MMGFDFRPSPGIDPDDATAYMRDYATQRRAWLAGRAGFDVVTDDDGSQQVVERAAVEKKAASTVTTPMHRIEGSELGTSAKKIYAAAVAMGWQVSVWHLVADVEPVLYVADSTEKSKKEYAAGDVRFEGYIARWYVVEARHPEHPLGFKAFWMGKGAEGATAGFDTVTLRDPVGIDVENWVDYTKDKVAADALGWTEERRIQEGMAANNRINDGSMRREFVVMYRAAGDFTVWLDDWYLRACPDAKPLTPQRKPKETPEEREAALMSGGEWNG